MKIILLILISFLLSGCGTKEVIYQDTTNTFLNTTSDRIEVYSDTFLYDVIEIENGDIEITSDNYKIDTTKLGRQDLDVYYKYDNKKYVFKYSINVVDTTPPLVFSGTNKTVNIDYDGDICDIITYGDNYTGDVKCEVTGDYDFKKVGTYKLVFNLSDSSNNKKTVNVTLNVSKPTSGGTSSPKVTTNFKDIYNKHKTDDTEIGIDVSKWQGEIDFEKVKKSGASFVMMRIGVEGTSTNQVTIDEYYKNNIKKAKEAGLKVGVYLYSIATSVDEAINHADWVIKTLDGESLDLPIVFDWESWTYWNSYKISFYEINNIANNFLKRIEEKGYKGMLYSSKFYLETIWTNKDNYPVWLAHYTNQTNYSGDYVMWQLCNNGRIDGITGDVDIDIMYKKGL